MEGFSLDVRGFFLFLFVLYILDNLTGPDLAHKTSVCLTNTHGKHLSPEQTLFEIEMYSLELHTMKAGLSETPRDHLSTGQTFI